MSLVDCYPCVRDRCLLWTITHVYMMDVHNFWTAARMCTMQRDFHTKQSRLQKQISKLRIRCDEMKKLSLAERRKAWRLKKRLIMGGVAAGEAKEAREQVRLTSHCFRWNVVFELTLICLTSKHNISGTLVIIPSRNQLEINFHSRLWFWTKLKLLRAIG